MANKKSKSNRAVLPFTIQAQTYGHSVRGCSLEVYLPTSGNITHLIMAGFHSAEPDVTVVLSRAFLAFESIPDGMAIILTMNSDGVLLGSRANANGVDLNRNFPTADW